MTLLPIAKPVMLKSQAENQFGYSVALADNGETAVVGAAFEGAAYVFTRRGATWSNSAILRTNDARGCRGDDCFGASVAIDKNSNVIIVGAFTQKNQTGAIYVFDKSGATWIQQAKLTASDPAEHSGFGLSLAINRDGDTVVIGATGADSITGAVYLFRRTGRRWSQTAKLVANDGAPGDQLGRGVALSADGRIIAAGALAFNARQGAVYVFALTAPVILSPATLPAGTASGGTGTGFTFAVMAGALPPGLALSVGGALSGTPPTKGTYRFTVTVRDSAGTTGSREFTVVIAPAIPLPVHSAA